MLSGTPESRHQHVRRCTDLASRSLGLDGGGPLTTSSFTTVDQGAGGASGERCTELERSAPGVGTGLQVGGAVTFEANGGYPLLEQSQVAVRVRVRLSVRVRFRVRLAG